MPKNRLRELREGRNLSQSQIADLFDPPVDPSTISYWERGKVGIKDAYKQQLAEFFGVSVSFLMHWDEPDSKGTGNGHDVPVVA